MMTEKSEPEIRTNLIRHRVGNLRPLKLLPLFNSENYKDLTKLHKGRETENFGCVEENYEDDHNDEVFPLYADLFRVGLLYQIHHRSYGKFQQTSFAAVRRNENGDKEAPVLLKFSGRYIDIWQEPREVRILRKLQDCTHIPRVYGWHPLPETGSVVIVSEFLRENEVGQTMVKNPSVVRIFMRQLLETVAFLHDRGIIHRDIKSSNILWDRETQHLVLIDFDLSFDYHDESPHYDECGKRPEKIMVGTYGYMAPEIGDPLLSFRNSGSYYYDEKVDCFSAGIVLAQVALGLLEAQVGEIGYKADDFRKFAAQSSSSMPMYDLIACLLKEDPNSRPSAREALLHPYFSSS